MVFNTSKGEILFEKNARINASTTIPKSEDWYDLNDVPHLTLNDYIQNTKKAMGSRFFPYHPNTNNCQDFISGVLQANGIRDQNVYNFVKQDTSMIFKNKGWLSGMAKQVTDLGGYADVVMQGGSLSNELTNGEIDELVKHYKIKRYHGCFIDDKLPSKLHNGYYVINLNGHSHWCCLMKDGKKYFYLTLMVSQHHKRLKNKLVNIFIQIINFNTWKVVLAGSFVLLGCFGCKTINTKIKKYVSTVF